MGHVIVIRHEHSGCDSAFEVIRDDLRAEGPTLGVALDRLLDQLGETDEPLILVRQSNMPKQHAEVDCNKPAPESRTL